MLTNAGTGISNPVGLIRAGFHDDFRGSPGSFEKAMATYDELEKIQERDPRLRIHAISTSVGTNTDDNTNGSVPPWSRNPPCPNSTPGGSANGTLIRNQPLPALARVPIEPPTSST